MLRLNWKFVALIIIAILIAGTFVWSNTELLKSKPVLKAILVDDLTHLNLTLREDKTFELLPMTWLGSSNAFTGKYRMQGNKIIFLDRPYDNEFIPDTVDIFEDKLILNGDITQPDTSFARYFTIHLDLLETH